MGMHGSLGNQARSSSSEVPNGRPPSSSAAMAVTALAFYVVLALLAAWVERSRLSRQ